ncbi:hypothetical protein ABZ424_26500 [Streptomyces sp. NPDC005790]|uniref:hypothetical protein n=1 Tax=Streptomyces sp. NPDC005790 TaxID=3154777 RepID=UPI0034113A63
MQDFFDALPAERREYFVGHCAESALVSDQLWGLDRQRVGGGMTTLDEAASHFAGAVLVAKKIRSQGDGPASRASFPKLSTSFEQGRPRPG